MEKLYIGLQDDGEYHLFYYEKMVKLKIGMDFVELYFKDDKAGRFAIPHRIREHYYQPTVLHLMQCGKYLLII